MTRGGMRNVMVSVTSAVMLLSGPSAAVRTSTAAMPSAAADTIHGVVFDSLGHQPIAGATVVADPGSISTTTDDQGRFTINAPGHVTQVAVFNDLLDRTGIGSLSARIGPGGDGQLLVLATPSLQTVWSRLCRGQEIVPGRTGVVFGTARTAGQNFHVAGARVRVSWDPDANDTAPRLGHVVEARTDSLGGFYACGVPPLANLYAIALSAQYSSGAVVIVGDSLPLRKQDLLLGAPDQRGTVAGIARDQRHAPLKGVAVDIDGVDVSATTDQAGQFRVTNVPTGSRTLLARAVGYQPAMQAIEVLPTGGDEVQIELQRQVLLPGVKVTERSTLPRIQQEFEDHRRMGFGEFVTEAEIAKRLTVRSVFQGIPGLTVQSKTESEFDLLMPSTTGYCTPTVFLDAVKSDTKMLVTLPKNRIAAVEVYLRPTEVPARYAGLQNLCGLILAWTTQAFRR